jgi:hypothetical protein
MLKYTHEFLTMLMFFFLFMTAFYGIKTINDFVMMICAAILKKVILV